MKKRIVIYLVLLTNILLSQKIITPKDVKLFLLSIVENADTDIIQKYGKDADDLQQGGSGNQAGTEMAHPGAVHGNCERASDRSPAPISSRRRSA